MNTHTFRTNVSGLGRREDLEGRPHLVYPCVLMREGVWNGVYYPAKQLSRFPESWNGRPVVVPTHPTVNGIPVTANSKAVQETMQVGILLNTTWDGSEEGKGALKSEIWFDEEKLATRSPATNEKVTKGLGCDVSTGLFTDDTMLSNAAEFAGKPYKVLAENYRPDHLACLPFTKGACSWEDGAGVPRINSALKCNELDQFKLLENPPKEDDPEEDDPNLCPDCDAVLDADGNCPICDDEPKPGTSSPGKPKQNALQLAGGVFLNLLSNLGFRVNTNGVNPALEAPQPIGEPTTWTPGQSTPGLGMSMDDLRDAVSRALTEHLTTPESPKVPPLYAEGAAATSEPNAPKPWVQSLYADFVIYSLGEKTYRLGYSVDTAGVVTFEDGEPVAVQRRTLWVPEDVANIPLTLPAKPPAKGGNPPADPEEEPEEEESAQKFPSKKRRPAFLTNKDSGVSWRGTPLKALGGEGI